LSCLKHKITLETDSQLKERHLTRNHHFLRQISYSENCDVCVSIEKNKIYYKWRFKIIVIVITTFFGILFSLWLFSKGWSSSNECLSSISVIPLLSASSSILKSFSSYKYFSILVVIIIKLGMINLINDYLVKFSLESIN